jgi:hypothetical protein
VGSRGRNHHYFGGIAKDEWELWRPTVEKLQESDREAFIKFRRMAERSNYRPLPPPPLMRLPDARRERDII